MPFDFLTPRIERLEADGEFNTLHPGGGLGWLRPPVVLIARSLCTFKVFDRANMSRAQTSLAARLHLRTASPYLESGSLMSRGDGGYGLWWWDAKRVNSYLASASTFRERSPMLRPETLAQPRAEGFRIVRLHSGYEAQYWRDKQLLASTWRATPFDVATWRGFCSGIDASGPLSPPPPEVLGWTLSHRAFSPFSKEIRPEEAAAYCGALVAFAAAALGAFWFGQGEAARSDRLAVEREVAEIRRTTPQSPSSDPNATQQRQMLSTYRELEERTNPLSAAGAALAIAGIYDLNPQILDASEETVSMALPYEDGMAAIARLAPELEASGYFHDVRPKPDGARRHLIVEMKVRSAAPPLEPLG